MYNGSSSYDSGQVANGQWALSPGPKANWLETQSKHQQQQQKKNGEPVAVRVMTNGTGCVSERPVGKNQQEPTSPAHIAYLYDRAQQPVESKSISPCPNGFVAVTSPHSDEYRSFSRAVPAPLHQYQQRQPSTAARTSADEESSEYNPLSRATPAPIQQHLTAGAQRPTTLSPSSAEVAMPTSPQATQQGNSEPRAAEVSRQLSQLGVADGQQPSQRTSTAVVAGSGPVGNQRVGRTARQPPPTAFTRRQSAPGPIGQAVEPGSRKPWSYTPSFGVGCGTGRAVPTSSRPIMQPTSHYTPRVRAAEGLQSNGSKVNSTNSCSQASITDAVDSASIRYKLREGEDPIAYDETSIRYRGRANPSKTFRLLQSATGSDSDSDSTLAYATARRPRRQRSKKDVDEQLQQPHADDIVDISYVGSNIPSRTFRILQQAVGAVTPQENGSVQPVDASGDASSLGSGRNIRVIHLRSMKKHPSVDNIMAYSQGAINWN